MQILLDHKPTELKGALVNNGELDIHFLGVGSAFAQKHFQTSILIVKGDHHVLVDFGMDGPRALAASGVSMADIVNFLPTHSHADHVGGVEALALFNRYVVQKFMNKPKLICVITPEYQRILWDYTLRGGLEWNEEQPDGRRKLGFGDFFNILTPSWMTSKPRESHAVMLGDIKIELFRTNHIPEQAENWEASFVSYGLVIDNRIFYSADSQFDEKLFIEYPGCEHYFHDVQFFPGAVHASLDELKTLDTEMKSDMTLMHYNDEWEAQDITGFAGWAQQGSTYRFEKEE